MLPHCAGTVLWVHDGGRKKVDTQFNRFLKELRRSSLTQIGRQAFPHTNSIKFSRFNFLQCQLKPRLEVRHFRLEVRHFRSGKAN